MQFDFSEDQRLLRDAAKEVAQKEIAPLAAAHDQEHAIRPKVMQLLGELGFLGSYLPMTLGGAGVDFVSYILLVEEVSKACAATGVVISAHTSLCCNPILKCGSASQQATWLPPLAQGSKIGCFLLTEPGAGTDAGGIQTRFVDQGDHYLVQGSKLFITNGGFLGTGVLFATSDPQLGHQGISAFILDLQSQGVQLLKNEEKMGIRGSYTSAFSLDQVKVPKENLLGKLGQGFEIAMHTLNGGRIGISAQALGIGQAALDLALAYAQERKQFGKELARFQAIQFKLADMAMELEAARLLTYKAAWLKAQGRDYALAGAMAKAKASEAANFCATEALQIHGGYGYMTSYPLERLYRDAKITEIYEGTSEVQRIVIAKHLLEG